jgi:NAD(P)-dependent dehydrogenase (short-subunit alcohol dehydrogenase family)
MSISWLQGKTVFVTGAASELGAATAVELHRLGARLALVDRDAGGVQRVAEGIGPDAIALSRPTSPMRMRCGPRCAMPWRDSGTEGWRGHPSRAAAECVRP